MKHMKKMMAMFLAIIMVVVLAVPAFAAESKTYTITINNDKDDHTYEAYQVFSGDLSENVLSNIQWGTGVNGDALLTALKEGDAFENAFDNCTTPPRWPRCWPVLRATALSWTPLPLWWATT